MGKNAVDRTVGSAQRENVCLPKFSGAACDDKSCPSSRVDLVCSGKGVCDGKAGKCICHDPDKYWSWLRA